MTLGWPATGMRRGEEEGLACDEASDDAGSTDASLNYGDDISELGLKG